MTDYNDRYEFDSDELGLAEFESDNVVTLVEFENESTLLLDEFDPGVSGMLEELNTVLEIIHEDGLGSSVDDGPATEESDETDVSGDEEEKEEDEDKDGEEISEPVVKDEELLIPEPEKPLPRPKPVPEPMNPVIGFVCEHALDISKLTGPRGRMTGRRKVFLVQVPCSAMVKPSWLGYSLAKGASGVFIVACSPDLCHHRTGAEINERRLNRLQEPALSEDVEMRRIRLFKGHPSGRDEVMKKLDAFLRELSELDKAESMSEEIKAERENEKSGEDWLM